MYTPALEARHRSRVEIAATLVVSGVLGLHAGAVQFPVWQVAVETAQVVAGVVRYPTVTPFSVYHAELWTILHQVLAVFLRFGVSEITLSRGLSGVLGMLSFQAIALVVYAISRDALTAIGASALVWATHAAEFGVLYPVFLLGSSHTYGIIGLSFLVLVVALIGCGVYRTAAFLLGLAPAVHPSLGAWLLLIVALAVASDYRRARVELRPAIVPLLAGIGISGLSLLLQLATRDAVPSIASGEAARYLAGFIRFWDGHRQPVPANAEGVALNLIALFGAGVWLVAFANDLTRPVQLFLRVVCATSTVSLALVALTWVPPERLPQWLLVLMPGRLLNATAFMCVPMLIGLIALYRRTTWGSILGLVFVCALAMVNRSALRLSLESRVSLPSIRPVQLVQITMLVLFILVLRAWNQRRLAGDSRPLALHATPLPMLQRPARALTLLALVAISVWAWRQPPANRAAIFVDRTNDTALRLAADGHGLVLTAGDLHLIQLRTRRPVLLDGGGLDGIAYSIAAAPQMEEILRDVYGVDYFHPPDEARRTGAVPAAFSRKVWEARPLDEWRAIARRYGVSDIVTPSDWTLTVPIAAQSRDFRLYRVIE
jgi:hypothetical protein